jgi:Fe-S oxidoreductase
MMTNLEVFGDAMGKGTAKRADLYLHLDLQPPSKTNRTAAVLLWTGCAGAFHPRNRETLKALGAILKAGNVDYSILGENELCCGDPARRLGEEDLFVELAEKNIQQLNQLSAKEIVTLCPHCYNMLKNEYPGLGGKFKVRHAVEFVHELLSEKRIHIKYPSSQKRITVHDPCYLGRANSIYQPLRDMVNMVPDAEIIEMPQNRESAMCCGGGGGRMWLHEHKGRNINGLRAEEAYKLTLNLLVLPAHTV